MVRCDGKPTAALWDSAWLCGACVVGYAASAACSSGGMKVRRSKLALHGLAALAAAVALFPTAAAADDWDTCGKQSGDLAIAACSRAIGSGRYTGQSLARLYTARGVAYQAKGDLDRAMADFNGSMRVDVTYARAYTTRGIIWYRKG